MGWSKKYKRSIDCNNPKGFSQKAHCAGRKKRESVMSSKLEELVGKPITEAQFDEAAGKKDACYYKVKARYDVWPSAYASGALVKCRKVGAKNWGNKSKKEGLGEVSDKQKRKIYKKAFGKEYDDPKRKQTPLPLDIAYKVALNKLKKKEGLNERAWTPDQTKAVDKVDNEFNKLMAKKGIEPYSVEAARLWKSAGFDKKMGKIFGKNESVNEQSKVIKSIDNLAKKNKYGTVTGTQMNGKTANTIMKIYNHPKMKKHKKALDNFTSDELVNLTMTLPKTLGIKEDINEGLDDLKNIPPDLRKTMKKKRLEGNNQLDSRTGNLDRLIRIVKSKKQDSQTEKQLKDLMKMRNKKESVDEARGTCWVGYQQVGMKKKGDRMVPNCVKEITEIYYEENGKGYGYTFEHIKENDLNEAEYQGRKVKLGKIMQGDTKKFKVYVKNPKGNVVKVNFGQGGSSASKTGGTMRIRKSNPKARANFRARHNCDNPGPRHKARYWSCRKW
tara:strand:- start:3182 stop:4681 length:1500 start_codon:yes stop_codon:yes gene_type:complete